MNHEAQHLGQLMATYHSTTSTGQLASASRDAWLQTQRSQWGRTAEVLLNRFNPDVQRYCATNVEKCFRGDTPTLSEVRLAYSAATVDSWLDIQLADLVRFCGVKGKEEFTRIIDPVIQVISDNFGYLKLSEMMLFFQQFKAGRYGRFYGTVDPMVITEALQQFLEFRADRLAVIERKRRSEEHVRCQSERAEQERRGELLTAEEWKEIGWLFKM